MCRSALLGSSIQASVLNGFRHMFNVNIRGCLQIGKCTQNLENPVIGPGRETQPVDGRIQHRAGRRINLAEFPDLAARHLRIAVNRQLEKPLGLWIARAAATRLRIKELYIR